ncbi:hypothetical protein LAZ67_8002567 [Cordylochernes scorpioides]|uniref:Uncharacterized protein n=1 Tax=Cordylochernes scorpioides TaxID=51811 RepID=A0ABY6KR27_9ARAC|nr:hypothetical protein LAZ67_8002567 [Cordylochernes scorpioides]
MKSGNPRKSNEPRNYAKVDNDELELSRRLESSQSSSQDDAALSASSINESDSSVNEERARKGVGWPVLYYKKFNDIDLDNEVILNHDYHKSKILRGEIKEKIEITNRNNEEVYDDANTVEIGSGPQARWVGKFVTFSTTQEKVIENVGKAIEDNNPKEVRLLLEKGVDPNIQNSKGNTPLEEAAFKGHTEVARLLLDNGAEVNYVNSNEKTPLLIAVFHMDMRK